MLLKFYNIILYGLYAMDGQVYIYKSSMTLPAVYL